MSINRDVTEISTRNSIYEPIYCGLVFFCGGFAEVAADGDRCFDNAYL
jgi:hypothetical protein